MARLIEALPPGHWTGSYLPQDTGCVDVDEHGQVMPVGDGPPCDDLIEHCRLGQASLDAIDPDKLWMAPVGDGYAYYLIHSEEPLVISHIPFLDAYRAMPATLRGLARDDIEQERRFRQILGR